MLIAVLWVAALSCAMFGAFWIYLNMLVRSLIEAEVELMKQPGILGDKPTPEALRRVSLSEGDLAASKRHRIYACCLLVIGILMILALLRFS